MAANHSLIKLTQCTQKELLRIMHVLKRCMGITLRFNSEPVPQVLAAGHYVGGGGVRVCVCGGGVSAREVHSVLVLL